MLKANLLRLIAEAGPVARGIFETLLIRRDAEVNTGTAMRTIRVSVLSGDDLNEVDLPRWAEFMNTLVESQHLTLVFADESYIVVHRELDADILTKMYCTFLKQEASRETHVKQMQMLQPRFGGEYHIQPGARQLLRFDDNWNLAKLLMGQIIANTTPQPKPLSFF